MARFQDWRRDILAGTDFVLLALCSAATIFGIVMIYSATRFMDTWRFVMVQLVAFFVGVVLFFLAQMLNLAELMRKKAWVWMTIFNIAFIFLLLTPFGIVGDTGNRAWLKFPFLPVNIQPAELVKLTFILVLAYQLTWLKEKRTLHRVSDVGFLAANLLLLFCTYYFISSDMGSALVFVFIFLCMCFVAGVSPRWFVSGFILAALAFYIMWNEDLIPVYMKERFIVVFDHSYDPMGVGWHQTRSLMTLGGGKFSGMGFCKGIQTQSSYSGSLPNRHTDFIFSVIGEELGLLGCLAVLVLLSAIIVRCIIVAHRARTKMDCYVCVGMVGMLLFQVVANVGMCLFVMPVIGLTLPFFSYGGSSILSLFLAMGLVSGVHNRSVPDWLR